jgi:hypothetical protein
MRWVRTTRRCGTWLALAAMALQLVLSFGHVHFDKVGAGSVAAKVADTRAPPSKSSPAQHPSNETDDYCAICATLHLASTSLLPGAPPLSVPSVTQIIEHLNSPASLFVARQRTAFQSRAPPLT